MPGDVTTCRNCSAKNRLKAPPPGRLPRCGRCGSALPWVTNASDADFDRSVDAPTPVVVGLRPKAELERWIGPHLLPPTDAS